MRGSFPLNGTYFQVNEVTTQSANYITVKQFFHNVIYFIKRDTSNFLQVFADHASSISPLNIPRYLLWNLPRKTVYFGTSVTSIFRGKIGEHREFKIVVELGK